MMHDVEPRLYTTVIREMLRHENDVTNHRIMWLLPGQGLIDNRRRSRVRLDCAQGVLIRYRRRQVMRALLKSYGDISS